MIFRWCLTFLNFFKEKKSYMSTLWTRSWWTSSIYNCFRWTKQHFDLMCSWTWRVHSRSPSKNQFRILRKTSSVTFTASSSWLGPIKNWMALSYNCWLLQVRFFFIIFCLLTKFFLIFQISIWIERRMFISRSSLLIPINSSWKSKCINLLHFLRKIPHLLQFNHLDSFD